MEQSPQYVIEMLHITKEFPGIKANDDITLQLRKGEIHALLGENGAGKSTLMSVLFGLYQPEEGEIRKNGKPVKINDPNDATALGIGMVHQHFKLIDVFTVLDNIILGAEDTKLGFLQKKAARQKVQELSQRYGLRVDLDAKVEDITVGMQQRVEILKMLYRDNEILIFDEPTAVLTPQEIDELMDIMRSLTKEGKSILFISHKLNEIMAVADRVTVLRKGRYVGTVNTCDTNKQELSNMMVGRPVQLQVVKEPAQPKDPVLRVRHMCVASHQHKRDAVHDVSLEVRPQGDRSGGDQSAQEPGADETKSLRAAELPLSAVQDGTALSQLEQAGADALILEMKDSQGSLAWQSGESLAAMVTTGSEAVNAALEEWNRGDVYTIARVCAFRDNTLPYQDNRVALKAGYGNWRDEEKLRWLDPDSEAAREYIIGLCRELAQLGFDEIMLDQCWFPTQGKLDQIVKNGSYADGRFAESVEDLFAQLSQAVEPYGTRLSVRLPKGYQGADAPGGLSAKCLETYVRRIWVDPAEEEGEEMLAQRIGLENDRKKLAALTGQFAPEGPEAQGIIDEN